MWRAGLVLWIGAAVALMWWAPQAPRRPVSTPDEEAQLVRTMEWAAEDARRWREQRGDRVVPWAEAKGHLAIVIDDVGRELDAHRRLQALPYRLTFSILPRATYATGAQLRLLEDDRRYREIWLHLPMEPVEAERMSEGTEADEDFLRVDDDALAHAAKLEKALAAVPTAVGVNNHMGSALTQSRPSMDALMTELAARRLMFLDSRTIAESVAEAAASDAGVVHGRRHVFLDHEPSVAAIATQLARAARLAKEGPTIAIGHPNPELSEVLERALPQLHAEGIGIYPLSEVLERLSDAQGRAPTAGPTGQGDEVVDGSSRGVAVDPAVDPHRSARQP